MMARFRIHIQRWGSLVRAAACAVVGLTVAASGAAQAQAVRQVLPVPSGEQSAALVIAGAQYDALRKLDGVTSEAQQLAFELRRQDYQVTSVYDATYDEMTAAISAFLAGSRLASQRVVYVSGHSLSLDGHVFLAAKDSRLESSFDLYTSFVNLSQLVTALDAGGMPALLAVNAGFDTRMDRRARRLFGDAASGVQDGLAPPRGTDRVLVLHAQSQGAVTPDFDRLGSAFSSELLRQISRYSDRDFAGDMPRFIDSVRRASQGREIPAASSEFSGVLAFDAIPRIDPADQAAWDQAQAQNTLTGYDAYLAAYPDGAFAGAARQGRQDLLDAYGIVPIGQDYITLTASNLRQGPSTRTPVVATLGRDQRVYAMGKVSGQPWLLLRLEDQSTAFIYETLAVPYADSDFVRWQALSTSTDLGALSAFIATKPAKRFAEEAQQRYDSIIAAEREARLAGLRIWALNAEFYAVGPTNVRDYPSVQDGQVIASLDGLQKVQVIGELARRDWFEVRMERGRGFVAASRLQAYRGSDLEAWEAVASSDNIRELRRFTGSYPNSQFVDLAEERIEQLEGARDTGTEDGRWYRTTKKTPLHARPRDRSPVLAEIEAGINLRVIERIDRRGSWAKIERNQGFGYVAMQDLVLLAQVIDQAWKQAQADNTVEAYQGFLDAFPKSRFADDARAKIAALEQQDKRGFEDMQPTRMVVVNKTEAKNGIGRRGQVVLSLIPQDLVIADGKSKNGAWIRFSYKGQPAYVPAKDLGKYAGSERNDWDNVLRRNSRQGFEFYLRKHPNGRWVKEARAGWQRNKGTILDRLIDELVD